MVTIVTRLRREQMETNLGLSGMNTTKPSSRRALLSKDKQEPTVLSPERI